MSSSLMQLALRRGHLLRHLSGGQLQDMADGVVCDTLIKGSVSITTGPLIIEACF